MKKDICMIKKGFKNNNVVVRNISYIINDIKL